MIVTALAIVLLQTSSQSAALDRMARETQAELRALGTATDTWRACLNGAADRFLVSGEPADAIATAAVYECRTAEVAVFDAAVVFKMAALPSRSERDNRADNVEPHRRLVENEQNRLTHYVVMQRLQRR